MMWTTKGGEVSQGHENSGPQRSEGQAEKSVAYLKKHHNYLLCVHRSISGYGGDANSMVSFSIFKCAYGLGYTH